MRVHVRKLLLASAPGIALLWVLLCLILSPLFLEELELRLFDLRQRLQGNDEARRSDIVVVNVDEATISALDWPVPRNIWAAWLAALLEFEPRQVGFDVFMTHHLCDAYHDTLLSDVIAAGPVVLGVGLSIPENQKTGRAVAPDPADSLLWLWWLRAPEFEGSERIIHSGYVSERPLPVLLDATSGVGNVAVDPDRDGVIRRVPIATEYRGYLVPSFALALYLHRHGLPLTDCDMVPSRSLRVEGRDPIPLDGLSRMILHFSGGPGTFRTISFVQLLDRMERAILYDDETVRAELEFLTDATVIVGVTDPSLMDLPATPVHPRFPGPEIQATALDNLLRGKHISRSQRRWEILAAAGLALFGALVGLRLRPATGALLAVVAAVVFGALVFWAGKGAGIWFGMVMPLLALAGSYGTGVTVERLAKEREQRLVKDTFGKYVAPNILDDLLEDPKSILSRKGQKKEISILFSDVKGFSRLCEEHEAAGLLDQLNEYLSEMTEIVFKHGGTVDKFMGDGLMAFFGHPVEMADHAKRAVDAAREMQVRLASLRDKWETEGKLLFQIRVGVNSGEVIAGSMGGGGKMDYTVFGRSVNLAQRLESNCDVDGVLITKETLDKAGIAEETATPKTIDAKNIGTITAYQIPVGE